MNVTMTKVDNGYRFSTTLPDGSEYAEVWGNDAVKLPKGNPNRLTETAFKAKYTAEFLLLAEAEAAKRPAAREK